MFLVLGCAAGFSAVACGALGAHALARNLPPDLMAVYETAVAYHFYHALGLLGLGLASAHLPDSPVLKWAGAFMSAGLVLFSGSLYLRALGGLQVMGALAPVGGLCLMMAWTLFGAALLKGKGK